ncbi:hypothetical protein FHW69_002990 [Luteibacter sp. Sphag1AF]|uniref:XVIPCD domain-containing protein n=1 Tax=Luteibacter sp. Sphag1AF TaxID=2587031 RepID=UPI001613C67D|nr:XVIPCD domain-containing protein [Luteibacter sp. Sphag1AF]MBB3228355.1 hypothetical protein [Luteibacter sp. Sphag1AF]
MLETSSRFTGYQGRAYVNTITKEIVIAHRGTETSFPSVFPDALTDAGMVLIGWNDQLNEARAFTNHVLRHDAESASPANGSTPLDRSRVTVTGHSLGGTLAQITAYEFGLRGETFNAFGAVNLDHDIPVGGSQVINHVRATDVVSAASHHFGEVRIYATETDIAKLANGGYHDETTDHTIRNALTPISIAAHSIDNFAPPDRDATIPTGPVQASDMTEANARRAIEHSHAIGMFRRDVHSLRGNTVSLPWQLAHKAETAMQMAQDAAGQALRGDFSAARQTLDAMEKHTAASLGKGLSTATHTASLGIAYGLQTMERAEQWTGYQIDRTTRAVDEGATRVIETLHTAETAARRTMDQVTDRIGTEARHLQDAASRAADEISAKVHRGLDAVGDAAASISMRMERGARVIGEAATVGMHAIGDALAAPGTEGIWYGAPRAAITAPPASATVLLDDKRHPDHALYEQALAGVHLLDASLGRTPDQRSRNVAAALTVSARQHGMDRIDAVSLNEDGTKIVAAQDVIPDAWREFALVDAIQAQHQSIQESSRLWPDAMEQMQTNERQLQQTIDQRMTHERNAPAMSISR